MLDPVEVAHQGQGRDRAERVGIWISGLAHTGLVLWAIVGGALFAARENPRPQMTDVTTISTQEFDEMAARSRGAGPVGQADGNAPVQPQAPGDTTAPEGPDLALDAPDPDSQVATLPTPDAQSEDTPDLSDIESRTPPVDVATIAPDAARAPTAEATPSAPAADDAPVTDTPSRPDQPAQPEPPRSALALDRSRPPPDRPDGLRDAVLAARRAEEAEAAAAAERAEEQRLAALAREAEEAEQQAEAAAAQERDRIAREAAAEEEAERAEQERVAREQAEAERAEQERAEQERLAEELRRQEEERAEAERLEQERLAEAERQEQERLEQESIAQERLEQERLAEEARQQEAARLAEEARRAEEERRAEQQRLQREAELRDEEQRLADAEAEIARENALAEQLAEEERLQREAAMAEEATPSPVDGNAPEGEGEGGGSDVLTDALNEAGAAAIDPDQLDDALADAMGTTRPSEIVRDTSVEIASIPMTEVEKDSFRTAVQSCWSQSTLSLEALETSVVVGFTMDRSGVPDPDSFHIVGDVEAQPDRQQAFEAARRAVMRCTNGGYALPAEKYNEWDDVEMTFTPEGVGRIE
ncbi:MAG: hypothetical protein DI616_10540 [Paracoccus denitrificans]|uniref:Protein TolA n=1 Tax=Paracoccus denitrificans TaxID=266 RepID=A0A533I3Z2_PARDE|nr:MAG: hypothetical protein DI616_10540 [Paracoccus denitrificans]